jgi:hypothetical protein
MLGGFHHSFELWTFLCLWLFDMVLTPHHDYIGGKLQYWKIILFLFQYSYQLWKINCYQGTMERSRNVEGNYDQYTKHGERSLTAIIERKLEIECSKISLMRTPIILAFGTLSLLYHAVYI